MNKLIEKITSKKEFSRLPEKDVLMAFERFDVEEYSDEEKVKFTRELLMKVFSVFTSQKILSAKDRDVSWILKKHLSTRERLDFYEEIYPRVLKGLGKKISVIDLGAGINGLSYGFFKHKIDYVGVESMGQLVDLMNKHFKKNKLKSSSAYPKPDRSAAGRLENKGAAIHASLFELEKIKKIVRKTKTPRVVFLFKVVDSLEMMERNYSKKLINALAGSVDRFVVSFATRSLIRGTKFFAKRNWFENFAKENFKILDDFEFGSERYFVFGK